MGEVHNYLPRLTVIRTVRKGGGDLYQKPGSTGYSNDLGVP